MNLLTKVPFHISRSRVVNNVLVSNACNFKKSLTCTSVYQFRPLSTNPMEPNAADINNKKNKKVRSLRVQGLDTSNFPDLSKLDPILDVPGPIVDPPFPVTRPSVVITAPETESDDIDALSIVTRLSPSEIRDLQKRTLIIKRVSSQTEKGRIPSMYALVVVGNGKGVAGFGEGKHDEVQTAIKKATNIAIKSLRYFERYDDRTLYHDIEHKFHGTTIKLWARPPGFGIRCNHYIHEVAKCVGIQDISAKVHGSCNGMNVIKCTFEALNSQNLPSEIAKSRGKNLMDVYHTYYGTK
ncbi:3767_t:CDS:2 [Funneliformis caledonium]|uniref:Small ribosomal subunit protein uS5m n=1 Tax=Funneliformis caledonium TaxID=1117310 RepID=A0A9N9A976_9GLOM|nr:3767_t:CDS:2 [Funneliformis caledonium]